MMSLIISQYEKYQRRVYEWMEGPLLDAVQCDVNGDTQINLHLYTPVHVSLEDGRSFHIIIFVCVLVYMYYTYMQQSASKKLVVILNYV